MLYYGIRYLMEKKVPTFISNISKALPDRYLRPTDHNDAQTYGGQYFYMW